jgi:hypothetical protein
VAEYSSRILFNNGGKGLGEWPLSADEALVGGPTKQRRASALAVRSCG